MSVSNGGVAERERLGRSFRPGAGGKWRRILEPRARELVIHLCSRIADPPVTLVLDGADGIACRRDAQRPPAEVPALGAAVLPEGHALGLAEDCADLGRRVPAPGRAGAESQAAGAQSAGKGFLAKGPGWSLGCEGKAEVAVHHGKIPARWAGGLRKASGWHAGHVAAEGAVLTTLGRAGGDCPCRAPGALREVDAP